MPTKARQLASATICRRSRTGRRRLMSLHVRDVHYEVHARAPAIKFSASRAGGAASAPHALPALALAAVLAASCQYVPLSRCRTVRSRISRGLIGPHPVDAPNVPDAWPLGRLSSRPSARRARAALGERVAYRERPNVLRPNVLRCVGFRTWLQLSRDIVGTSTEVGGRPCRRGNSSSLRWWLKDAAKARSPATTTSPDNGSSNCAGGMRPRARRRSDRAHDAPHQCPSGAPRRRRPHPSAPQKPHQARLRCRRRNNRRPPRRRPTIKRACGIHHRAHPDR